MKLAQVELERNQIQNKRLYNRKAKKRVFQVRDKVFVLLPTDHNKLLIQWKGPFKVKGCKGGNNYQIEVNRKMKTFHVNLLKQYVERDSVEMTATPGRRDSGGNPGQNWDRSSGCPGGQTPGGSSQWGRSGVGNLFLVVGQMSSVEYFGGPEFSLTL